MKKSRIFWHILAFVAVFAIGIAVVMLLWNALIPAIIGWSAINYWQAAGLMILSRLLFSGFGRRHWHGQDWRKRHKDHDLLHDKLRGMTKEEKREFIRKRMSRGGGFNGWNENDDEKENQSDK